VIVSESAEAEQQVVIGPLSWIIRLTQNDQSPGTNDQWELQWTFINDTACGE